MQRLFGLPVGTLTAVVVVTVSVALGVVAALGVRNRIFLKLGVRNLTRRRARTAVIVAGLMLGTAIIASALGTGDTMASTVRSSVITSLGRTDEVVAPRTAKTVTPVAFGQATGVRYLSQAEADRVEAVARQSKLVDGAAPAIVEPVAVQDRSSSQNEPRVTLFATDPAKLGGFGQIHDTAGRTVSLAALQPGEVYLNADAADSLGAKTGDQLLVLAGSKITPARVRAVVRYEGTGSDSSALMVPLATAQQILDRPGQIKQVLISNVGGVTSGAANTDAVRAELAPVLEPLGLDTQPVKTDGLEAADKQGNSFMSMFTTFGTFTISAGILLIFLVFVMLAAERRGELGIARAIGTQRGHLVQMFLFEGVAYDLVAAAVGAALGLAVAFGMVQVLSGALATSGLEVRQSFRWGSLALAYTIGVLLTLIVVTISAWRVSRLNVVSAIRNLPEPPRRRRRARWASAAAVTALGALMVISGMTGAQAAPFLAGGAVLIGGLTMLVRAAGVSERLAYTAGGLAILIWELLPFSTYQRLVPGLKMDFSVWVVVGLILVVGATWVIVWNTDVLVAGLTRVFGRVRSARPVLKTSMAQPMRNRFRTGTTIALFMLVVFTMVTGATTSGAFLNAMNDVGSFGGGYQVRAETAPLSPVSDMAAAVRAAPGLRAGAITSVASQSFVPVEAQQPGPGAPAFEGYPVRGLDDSFLHSNTFKLAAMARGYNSARDVWNAVAAQPGLAVVDGFVVPRRSNWNFGSVTKFRLRGFALEDKVFDPIPVDVRDPQTGKITRLTVVGVLSDTAPYAMAGISTSQRALASFGSRATPSAYYFKLAKGVDAVAEAKRLESAFLAHGMQAKAVRELLNDAVSSSLTFQWLILGFLGLGLVIGVAALGVISARAVVERRQQIGVLRAIGFQRRMVQLSFLVESSFVTGVAIVVGTVLGLMVAYNVVADSARQPGYDNLTFSPPWLSLLVILVVVFLASLATTWAPARRASRVYPADALRYE